MDIDEYLRQKKSLEEQKKILEGQQKVFEEKQKFEKPQVSTVQQSPSFESQPMQHQSQYQQHSAEKSKPASSGVKTLMMINMVVLFGVLVVFAIFYLFPPGTQNIPPTGNVITGQVVTQTGDAGDDGEDTGDTQQQKGTGDGEGTGDGATTTGDAGTEYVGPVFTMSIQDSTEGLFTDDGKLKNSGKILSVQGPTFYNDFSITLENKEREKILCSIDRKIDLDTNIDGTFDVEGIYSLDRHTVKIKPSESEDIKAGIESVPGSVPEYQGKGEVWVEYEARCYFCLDEKCDAYEKRGETKNKKFFRVRINDNLVYSTTNST